MSEESILIDVERFLLFLGFGICFPLMAFAQPADDALLNIRTERNAQYVGRVTRIEEEEKGAFEGLGRSLVHSEDAHGETRCTSPSSPLMKA